MLLPFVLELMSGLIEPKAITYARYVACLSSPLARLALYCRGSSRLRDLWCLLSAREMKNVSTPRKCFWDYLSIYMLLVTVNYSLECYGRTTAREGLPSVHLLSLDDAIAGLATEATCTLVFYALRTALLLSKGKETRLYIPRWGLHLPEPEGCLSCMQAPT